MMSTDTKLKRASTLRSSHEGRRSRSGGGAEPDAEIPRAKATEDGRESRGSPPMGYAHRAQRSVPLVFSQNLHSKGFGGGVALNTKTVAVESAAGLDKITSTGLLFVGMA